MLIFVGRLILHARFEQDRHVRALVVIGITARVVGKRIVTAQRLAAPETTQSAVFAEPCFDLGLFANVSLGIAGLGLLHHAFAFGPFFHQLISRQPHLLVAIPAQRAMPDIVGNGNAACAGAVRRASRTGYTPAHAPGVAAIEHRHKFGRVRQLAVEPGEFIIKDRVALLPVKVIRHQTFVDVIDLGVAAVRGHLRAVAREIEEHGVAVAGVVE